jgi:hypothetical protein
LIMSELACRDSGRQAPFERIAANNSDFIDADYVPTDITVKDPRYMKLDSMIKFFKHIVDREGSHGIENSFRFKGVLSGRKKGSLRPSRYKPFGADSGEDSEKDCEPAPARRRKRKRQLSKDPTSFLNSAENISATSGLPISQDAQLPNLQAHGSAPIGINISATSGLPISQDAQLPNLQAHGSAPIGINTTQETVVPTTPTIRATGLYTPADSPAPEISMSKATAKTILPAGSQGIRRSQRTIDRNSTSTNPKKGRK